MQSHRLARPFGAVIIQAAAMAAAILTTAPPNATAAERRFCTMPVLDGTPMQADNGDAWRLTAVGFSIPGLPGPVFTAANKGASLTIDSDRRLVPYDGLFPRSNSDRNGWVSELESSRIVAVSSHGSLSVLRPGSKSFESFGDQSARYFSVNLLPRRGITVAIRNDGVPLVVGESTLTPWLSRADVTQAGVSGIRAIHDSPFLGATVMIDADRQMVALTDEGTWHPLIQIKKGEVFTLFDTPQSGTTLMMTSRSILIAIRRKGGGATSSLSAEYLPVGGKLPGGRYLRSAVFGELLSFEGGGFLDWHRRWRRLTPNGFVDIPGGDTGRAVQSSGLLSRDLPSLGIVLIHGESGLYIYDGVRILPVEGGGWTDLGGGGHANDHASIGRVLFHSGRGLLELTSGLRLVPLPLPAALVARTALIDWPQAGVSLIKTVDGFYALDADLFAYKVEGSEVIAKVWARGTTVNPATGELVLTGKHGLFVVIDTATSGDDACGDAPAPGD